jgi:protein O-mannosyl-transferase
MSRARVTLLAAILAAAAIAVYGPAFDASFVNYDDPGYVTANPYVKEGFSSAALTWDWTTFAQGNWHPLTWMSHTLDWSLFADTASGHHATSVLLHAANAVLLFLFLASATGAPRRSWLVAGLFALHPLHVESVAWISERKDVLSSFFGLGAMWAYLRYARRPSAARMAPVALLMAASLCSKPMLVTLPLLLLLLDAWPLRRWDPARPSAASLRPIVVEKLPLFVLSMASAAVTLAAQRSVQATAMNAQIGIAWRAANAAVTTVVYLLKAVVPTGLAIFYPHPGTSISIPLVLVSIAALAAITIAAVRARAGRPYLFVGWLWYLVSLVPVIGLVQVGAQARADRYTYLPLVGVFIVATWGCADLVDAVARQRGSGGWMRLAPLLAGLAPLAVAASLQAKTWHDSVALWTRAIAVTAPVAADHAMLGNALAGAKRTDEAEAQYREALRLNPEETGALNGIGALLVARHQPGEALGYFEKALAAMPRFAEAHVNAAAALDALGRDGEALPHALAAIAIDPASADGHRSAGVLLYRAGRPVEAVAQLAEAHRLDPARVETLNDLGMAQVAAGRLQEGIASYRQALSARPEYPEALSNLGGALTLTGDYSGAERLIRRALAIVPDYPKAHSNLAAVYYLAGRVDDARREIERARAAGFEPPRQLVEALGSGRPE